MVPAWPFSGQMGTLSPPGAAALVEAALPDRALDSSPMRPGQHTSISDGDMRPHHCCPWFEGGSSFPRQRWGDASAFPFPPLHWGSQRERRPEGAGGASPQPLWLQM